MKQWICLAMAAMLSLLMFAQAQVDYAQLDDMSLEQLEQLQTEVNARINALTAEGAQASGLLTLESAGGAITYAGFVLNDQNFKGRNSNEPVETLVVMFDYTNKEDKEKQLQNDFWIKAFQNGVEMDRPGSWSNTDTLPPEIDNFYKSVLKGGTLCAAQAFIPADDSPVTLVVSAQGSSASGESAQMVLDFRNTPEGSAEAPVAPTIAAAVEPEAAPDEAEAMDVEAVDALLQGKWSYPANGGAFEFADGSVVLKANGSTFRGTYVINAQTGCVDITLKSSNGDVISHLPFTVDGNALTLFNNRNEALTHEATPDASAYETLQKGSRGDAVQALQKHLVALGYLTGGADGVYGAGTERGVSKFQAAEGLPQTGVADPETQARLFTKELP